MKEFFSKIKYDLPASIVVFLVAVPLCLGIALASGAPLFSGIIAGIIGGIVVSLISGSPLGVSGPAAGLAVIVLAAINEFPTYEIFLLTVVLAGVIQIVLGAIKAGVIGYYFPSSVIKGMLSGIGIIIILKQIPHAVGYDKDYEGDLSYSQPDGQTTFSEIINMMDYINPAAIIVAVVSLAILILWEQKFMKKLSFTNIIQGPLVVVVVGVLLNMYYKSSGMFELTIEQTVNIPIATSFEEFKGLFTFPDFNAIGQKAIWVTGLTIAVVASLETLLCVEATDKLDPQKRITPTNRELVAQGVGNIASGMIGGLPITQVIVRSSANIQSGGRTKASAFFHGVLILGTVLLIPTILNQIPLASLAAILFLVGYKLASPKVVKAVFKQGKEQFIPFVVTVVGIVRTDLLIGIGLGLVVAIFFILWKNYQTPYHFDEEDVAEGKPIQIKLAEDVSFLNKAGILHTLTEIPNNAHVIIDASRTKSMHVDVKEIIEDFKQNAETRNIKLEIHELGWTPNSVDNAVKKFGTAMAKGNGGMPSGS